MQQVGPDSVIRLAQSLGVRYIAAPISGGAATAASGQMTMMTSGAPAAYARLGRIVAAASGLRRSAPASRMPSTSAGWAISSA